jgi:2-methylcitrate dehydratase PrpD
MFLLFSERPLGACATSSVRCCFVAAAAAVAFMRGSSQQLLKSLELVVRIG